MEDQRRRSFRQMNEGLWEQINVWRLNEACSLVIEVTVCTSCPWSCHYLSFLCKTMHHFWSRTNFDNPHDNLYKQNGNIHRNITSFMFKVWKSETVGKFKFHFFFANLSPCPFEWITLNYLFLFFNGISHWFSQVLLLKLNILKHAQK